MISYNSLNSIEKKRLLFDRSNRLQKKLLNINYILIKRCLKNSLKNSFFIYKRSLRILDFFVGKRVLIYNGRIFRKLLVTKNHIGFFFGEFSFTRRYGMGVDMHKRRKKKTK